MEVITPIGAAAILAGGSLLSGLSGAIGSTAAAQAQAQAAQQATALQQQEFGTIQNQLSPFYNSGVAAQSELNGQLGIGSGGLGALLQPIQNQIGGLMPQYQLPTAQQYQQSPGYNFALQGAVGAAQNAASNTTGPASGNTLRAIAGIGSGLANQDYQQFVGNTQSAYGLNSSNWLNQFNALNTQNTNQFNWLNQGAAQGQNAAANIGNAGLTTAQSVGNNIIGAGTATGAGILGATNATSGVLNSLGTQLASPNNYQNSVLGALFGQGGGGGSTNPGFYSGGGGPVV